MAIGLTADELFAVFIASLQQRANIVQGQVQAARHGENPNLVAFGKELRPFISQVAQLLSVPEEKAEVIMGGVGFAVLAMADMIVANNEAIAKSVPHVEG